MTTLDPARIGSILITMNSHFQRAETIIAFEDAVGGRGTTNDPLVQHYLDPITGFAPASVPDLDVMLNKYLATAPPGLPTFYLVDRKYYAEEPQFTDLTVIPQVLEPQGWMFGQNPFLLRKLQLEQVQQQQSDPPEFFIPDSAQARNVIKIRETSATYDATNSVWTSREIGGIRDRQKIYWTVAPYQQGDPQQGISLATGAQEIEFDFDGELEFAVSISGVASETHYTAPATPVDGLNEGVANTGAVGANFVIAIVYQDPDDRRIQITTNYISAGSDSHREFEIGVGRTIFVRSGGKMFVDMWPVGESTVAEPLASELTISDSSFSFFFNRAMPDVVDEPDVKDWENILPTQALGTTELTRYELNKPLAQLKEIKFEVAYGFGSHTAQLRIMTESIPIHNIAFVDDAVQGVPGSSSYRYTIVLDSNTGCQSLQARRIFGSPTTTNFLRFLLYRDIDSITDIGVFGATIRHPSIQSISISKVYVR